MTKNSDKRSGNEEELFNKNIVAISILGACTIIVGVVLYFVSPHYIEFSWYDILFVSLGALFGALFTTVIIGVIYEFLTKKNFLNEMRTKVSEAFLFDKSNIDGHHPEKKIGAVRIYLESILGEERGAVLYKEMVAPYLEAEKYSYRQDFNYDIKYKEENNSNGYFVCFNNKEEYRFVHETLEYEKCYSPKVISCLKLGFAVELKTLENWFGDDKMFFREILDVNKEESEAIKKMDVNDIKDFAMKFMGIEVSIIITNADKSRTYKNIKDFSVEKYESNGAFIIKCDLEGILNDDHRTESYRAKIKFMMPQRREVKRFLVTLPELTEAPRIDFHYTDKMKIMNVIPFFTNIPNDKGEYITHTKNAITVSYKERWIFPKSGVLFVWD